MFGMLWRFTFTLTPENPISHHAEKRFVAHFALSRCG